MTHFRDLAVFGEQMLLSIRFGDWSVVNDATQAGNWARYWRPEIQWYIHAYRAVTGVDLSRRARSRPARRWVATCSPPCTCAGCLRSVGDARPRARGVHAARGPVTSRLPRAGSVPDFTSALYLGLWHASGASGPGRR